MPASEAAAGSPLLAAGGSTPLPRFHLAAPDGGPGAEEAVGGLNEQGYWPARLGSNSHPFVRPATAAPAPGDFSRTHVGDETDTSPFPDQALMGISTQAYIRHMRVLIRAIDQAAPR
jgi:hypothetical protein